MPVRIRRRRSRLPTRAQGASEVVRADEGALVRPVAVKKSCAFGRSPGQLSPQSKHRRIATQLARDNLHVRSQSTRYCTTRWRGALDHVGIEAPSMPAATARRPQRSGPRGTVACPFEGLRRRVHEVCAIARLRVPAAWAATRAIHPAAVRSRTESAGRSPAHVAIAGGQTSAAQLRGRCSAVSSASG